MYRSRSLLVLFRERRKVLTAQRQVVRYGVLQCQKVSKRRLSDSVKVLSQREEYEDRDEKTGVGKSSRQKLFSLDDIFEEEGRVTTDEKQQNAEDNSEQKANEAVLQKDAEEVELSEVKDTQQSKTEEKPNRSIVGHEQSDSEKTEIEEEQSSETDAVFEEVEEVGNEKPEMKSGFDLKTFKKEEWFVLNKMRHINSMDNQNELLDALESSFNKKFSLVSKNQLIICVLKNLEKLEVMDLDEKYVKALQDHLDHNSQITKFGIAHLLNILDFFLKGCSEDNNLIFTLLHELCWRLRKSSLKSTLSILETVKGRQSTDKRREVYEMGKKRLLDNIGNVSSPQELLSVMYLLTGNKEAQMRVEEEASIMLQSMDSVQTYRLIYLLALNRSKNFALVANARKQLCSRPINLDMIKLKNLFFACDVLRITDPNFVHEMSVNMLDLLENDGCFDKNICLPVLLSCSKIGWNFKSLTNEIMKNLCEDIDSCLKDQNILPLMQLSSLVMSLGHLNLVEYGDLGLRIVEHLVSKQIRQSHMLNVVHSMACIRKAETGNVLEVLKPAFYQPVLDEMKDQPAFLQDSVKRKLLNLYGYLKEDLHETTPDIESQATKWRNQLQEKMQSAPLVGLAKVVSEVLTEIAPLEKYTNTNVVTKYGYNIDFEIFVDKKLKAVRLDNTEGMQKVWIKMLDYSGFIQGGREPEYSGDTAMMLRHLKSKQDATIVYVPYFDWSKHDKKVDHLLYLETKIKTAVAPDVEKESTSSSDLPEREV